MRFSNHDIIELLKGQSSQEGASPLMDIGYAIFLEPREVCDPRWTAVQRLVNFAVKKFTPVPAMAHVEIVASPTPTSDDGRVHYATYLGSAGANWQNRHSREDGIEYYLCENGARWRAIPIFGSNAAHQLRVAGDATLHAPYSLSMYLTSVPPLRALAKYLNDAPKDKGHCAVITARVLKESGIGGSLKHASAWYSPTTLYAELTTTKPSQTRTVSVQDRHTTSTITTLLHAPLSYATIRALGDVRCANAIACLSADVCTAIEEGVGYEQAQKRLARALLRWVLLRDDRVSREMFSERV